MAFTSDVELGSNMKAKNGYGQNGYPGPSSDLPGQHSTAGFVPQSSVPTSDWQTRKVSTKQLAPAHAQKGPKTGETVPKFNTRRASGPLAKK